MKEFFYPDEKSWNNMRGQMVITMKTLSSGIKTKEIKESFSSITKNTTAEEAGFGDIFTTSKDVIKSIFKTATKAITLDDYLNDAKEVVSLGTYIPASFGIELSPTWSEAGMVSSVEIAKKGSEALLGKLGSGLNSIYETFKAQGEASTKASFSPKTLKIFKPSFIDKPFKLSLTASSFDQARELRYIISIFRESCIPKDLFNAEWFEFPAVFDIDIFISNALTSDVSTDDDTLSFYRHFHNMGMTQFNPVPKSGTSLESPTKKGEYLGWDIDFSFTSLTRIYEETSVEDRINVLLNKLG